MAARGIDVQDLVWDLKPEKEALDWNLEKPGAGGFIPLGLISKLWTISQGQWLMAVIPARWEAQAKTRDHI
jgi:hypothetical protein